MSYTRQHHSWTAGRRTLCYRTDVVDVVQAAEAAAEVEDCLLQHSADLARGLGLHLHVSSKTLTALPLVLPGFIPDQRGLPEFLITLADILGQAGGSHNVEGLAEVRQWRPTCHVSADLLTRAITHPSTRIITPMLNIVHALQALAQFYAFTDCGDRADIGFQVTSL